MRKTVLAGVLALPLMAGCETFDPYSVEYDEIISEQGVVVYGNLMEDITGSRWWQFSASNSSDTPACVQVRLTSGSTSGHAMGDIYLIQPGDQIDIGYVTLPGRFNTNSKVWDPDWNDDCGYPPDA